MRAEEECHVWSVLLLVDPIGKYPPLHLHDCVHVLEYSICIIHLLGYQTSISKCEHITDENLHKEKILQNNLRSKLVFTILCIGWIAWWFSRSSAAIRPQVALS